MKHRIHLDIDLKALVRNYRKIAQRAVPASVLCVVKANAYGMGVEPYATALAKAGCRDFGVADPYEALALQAVLANVKAACSVQLLSAVLPDEIAPMVEAGVALPVPDLETAKRISKAAVKAGRLVRVHFKLDTGMGRLGLLSTGEGGVARVVATMRAVRALPGLDCEGVFTHFPVASDPKDPFTKGQVALFKRILAAAKAEGISFRRVHVAASDAIANFPGCAKPPFTHVRAGIALHGSFDPNGRRVLRVEPVMSLKARVAQVRDLPAGTTLGYGRTWRLDAPSRIATVAAGYADGLPLALSNRGTVFVGGKRCRIVGRISMDYTTVDVTAVPGVKVGDEVVFFGSCGSEVLTPADWATLAGTHAYDILCSFGPRVERKILR